MTAKEVAVSQLPIVKYFGFADVPREIVVRYHDQLYLLDCPFDDELDDYAPTYQVWALTPEGYQRFERGEWNLDQLIDDATGAGEIPVADVRFDPTRRQSLDDGIFQQLGLSNSD